MKKQNILARVLRKNSTPQELKLWKLLRNHRYNNLAFKRQYPIGNYIVDFVCKEKLIIIELDGGQHNVPEEIKKDNVRTIFLESKGFKIVRFWNTDIDNNIDGVFQKLNEVLKIHN